MSARDDMYLFAMVGKVHEDGNRAMAQRKLDAYRAEVLAEGGLLPKADVVAWLVKKAREGTPIEQLASKVARGAIRPDNLRMLPATFFEADRTYEYEPLHLLFRCDAVGSHPVTGEPSAVGWVRYPGRRWSPGDYSPAEYADGWTDVTEAGDRHA